MKEKKFDYKENGVTFSKATICVGDEVTLSYKGILAEKNAENIYLHFGYGESWEEKQLIPMQQEKGAYKLKLKAKYPGILHFCFKGDTDDDWDNNGCNNYFINIAEEAAKKDAAKKEVTKSETKKSESKKSESKKSESTKSETKEAEPKKEAEEKVKVKVKAERKRASKSTKTESKE